MIVAVPPVPTEPDEPVCSQREFQKCQIDIWREAECYEIVETGSRSGCNGLFLHKVDIDMKSTFVTECVANSFSHTQTTNDLRTGNRRIERDFFAI